MFSWLFPNSRLGKNTQLRGLLDCGEDSLRIDGVFRGVIRSDSTVTVGPRGEIQGDIQARHVDVAGRVDGTVVAHGKLRMRETGVIAGDAYYNSLRVDHGGVIEGRATTIAVEQDVDALASSHAVEALAANEFALTNEGEAVEAEPSPRPMKLSLPPRSVRPASERAGDSSSPESSASGNTSAWPSLSLNNSERVLSDLAANHRAGQGNTSESKASESKASESEGKASEGKASESKASEGDSNEAGVGSAPANARSRTKTLSSGRVPALRVMPDLPVKQRKTRPQGSAGRVTTPSSLPAVNIHANADQAARQQTTAAETLASKALTSDEAARANTDSKSPPGQPVSTASLDEAPPLKSPSLSDPNTSQLLAAAKRAATRTDGRGIRETTKRHPAGSGDSITVSNDATSSSRSPHDTPTPRSGVTSEKSGKRSAEAGDDTLSAKPATSKTAASTR